MGTEKGILIVRVLRALTRARSRCCLPIEFLSVALTEIFPLCIFYSFLLSSLAGCISGYRACCLPPMIASFSSSSGRERMYYYIFYIFEIKEVLSYLVGSGTATGLSLFFLRSVLPFEVALSDNKRSDNHLKLEIPKRFWSSSSSLIGISSLRQSDTLCCLEVGLYDARFKLGRRYYYGRKPSHRP